MLSPVSSDVFWTDDEVGLLHLLDEALHSTTDLDNLFFIILTAATAGSGFRFSRAALFLRDEHANRLSGVMGIGPGSAEEAGAIWGALSRSEIPLRKMLAGYRCFSADSSFNRRVKGFDLAAGEAGVCTRVLETRETFIVSPPYDRGQVPAPLAELVCEGPFAVTPVSGREARAAGILVGDNAFSYRQISERQVQLLSFFGERAGSMLELIRVNRELQNHVRALRESYRKLYRAQRRLMRSESLAAVGRTVALIEHEIRGPVSAIGLMAARLRRRSRPGSETGALSAEIYRRAVELDDFITRNLSFIRPAESTRVRRDLNPIIAEAISGARSSLGPAVAAVAVRKNLADGLPGVLVDPEQLRHAFTNVIENCLQFAAASPGGGGVVSVSSRARQRKVVVTVGDNGAGILPGDEERVFEPFFSRRPGGTGLGLAFARQVMELHGGSIALSPGPSGRGAEFRLEFPLPGDEAVSGGPAAATDGEGGDEEKNTSRG